MHVDTFTLEKNKIIMPLIQKCNIYIYFMTVSASCESNKVGTRIKKYAYGSQSTIK